jgi:hypothetical protein
MHPLQEEGVKNYLNHIFGKHSEAVAKCFWSKFTSWKRVALLANLCLNGTQINTISSNN